MCDERHLTLGMSGVSGGSRSGWAALERTDHGSSPSYLSPPLYPTLLNMKPLTMSKNQNNYDHLLFTALSPTPPHTPLSLP